MLEHTLDGLDDAQLVQVSLLCHPHSSEMLAVNPTTQSQRTHSTSSPVLRQTWAANWKGPGTVGIFSGWQQPALGRVNTLIIRKGLWGGRQRFWMNSSITPQTSNGYFPFPGSLASGIHTAQKSNESDCSGIQCTFCAECAHWGPPGAKNKWSWTQLLLSKMDLFSILFRPTWIEFNPPCSLDGEVKRNRDMTRFTSIMAQVV